VLLEERTARSVIGAFYDVYNRLGYGFLEAVDARALAIELRRRGLAFVREARVEVWYREELAGTFRADFIVERRIVVELKATVALGAADEAQLLNSLRASGLEVGLLLHFGPRARFRRVVAWPAGVSRVS
jgi:GxxExxY protein